MRTFIPTENSTDQRPKTGAPSTTIGRPLPQVPTHESLIATIEALLIGFESMATQLQQLETQLKSHGSASK